MVDEMDFLAVTQSCKFAKEHALENGPIERELIGLVRKLTLAHDLATAHELKDMEKEISKEVDNAIAKVTENPILKSFGVERKVVRTILP
ncbi:hypothetical protein ACQ4PT_019510 [Festuca glaucescens]